MRLACETLAERDRALALAYAETGLPEWRYQAPGFAVLARSIAYQQISIHAAAAIWGRVEALLGAPVTPEAFLAAGADALGEQGVSRPKQKTLLGLAAAVKDGLDLAGTVRLPADEARAALTALHGIGPWTAEVFRLQSGAPDAFPPRDAGLYEAYRLLARGKAGGRLAPGELEAIAESWQPWRGAAAHLLWGALALRRDAAAAL